MPRKNQYAIVRPSTKKLVRVETTLMPSTHAALKKMAGANGMSVSVLMEEICWEHSIFKSVAKSLLLTRERRRIPGQHTPKV